MHIYIKIILICASALCLDNSSESFRKHYGLSIEKCPEFIKSYRCMTSCKSMGFQIFRLNRLCKCTCHELKTTTILPFFKWRTNGTTITYPRTQSPGLYHIVGTLSPATEWTPSTATTETPECVYITTKNTTDVEKDSNSEIGAGDNETTVETGGGDGSSANDTTPDKPEGDQPDANNTEGGEPKANNPEDGEPDANNTEGGEPDSNNTEGGEPDANNTGGGEPDANNTEGGEPDANNTGGGEPDANTEPVVTDTVGGEPDVPDTTTPDANVINP